jgi:RNA polymerase sigma-70 factor (ECF subfamily)
MVSMSCEDLSEETLIQRWRAGDRDAGGELLRRHIPAVTAFLRRRTSHNVDELVQRTLVVCMDAVERFEGRSAFRVFLLGIARNQFLTSLRETPRPSEEAAQPATFPEDGPSQLVASKQELQVLFVALTNIASPFRDVLKMFYWEGMSIEEIASHLGIAVGTVKSRLGRGRSMLKERLSATNRAHGTLVDRLIDGPFAKVGNLA